MANEVLKSVGEDFVKINEQTVEAKEIMEALKEAGEDTVKMETEIRQLEIRKAKWERMLKNRGIKV